MFAFQYAAGVQARVIGKPSKPFFMSAVKQMGVPADEVTPFSCQYCIAAHAHPFFTTFSSNRHNAVSKQEKAGAMHQLTDDE